MNDDFQPGSTLSTNPGQVLLSEAVKPEFGTPVSVWGVSVLRGHWDLNIRKVRAGTDPLQGPRRLVGRFLIDLSSLRLGRREVALATTAAEPEKPGGRNDAHLWAPAAGFFGCC